jgi:dTMP kinase
MQTISKLTSKFIVLDGGEGCGKTTQTRMLADKLAADGLSILTVRDPGATHIGEQIRDILLNPLQSVMGMRCEMLLYMAARAQLMTQTILPALSAGQCVICDRFVSSTLAYQLGGEGLTEDEIRGVADTAVQRRWPDLTIVLDIPVKQSDERLNRPKDRIELRSREYHETVRQNYLQQARTHPKRYRVIDAGRDPQAVHTDLLNAVQKWAQQI